MTGRTLDQEGWVEPRRGLRNLAHVVYALHTLSLLIGIIGAATVVGAFVFGWPSIIAVILNYVKRSEVRGTWLESHFRWQIRTFWWSLLWMVVGAILFALVIGVVLTPMLFFVVGVWVCYRIARGWLALASHKTMPMPE